MRYRHIERVSDQRRHRSAAATKASSLRTDPSPIAERQILFNSLGIMLAIVIPVILATLGVAFWFRASNRDASYRPDFVYSGRIEVLVWAIPLMTVLLVGGVAWVGAHDLDPRRPINTEVPPLRVQVVSSIGNGCSSIPTKALPASIVWSSRSVCRSAWILRRPAS